MFKVLIEWMDVFCSCKLLEMLTRKEAARKAETGIFAMQVWEPVLSESPVTVEHFYSRLHWTWNWVNAQTEGQAGLGFLVPGLLSSFSVGARGSGGGSLSAAPGVQQVSVLELKACRGETLLLLQGLSAQQEGFCVLPLNTTGCWLLLYCSPLLLTQELHTKFVKSSKV